MNTEIKIRQASSVGIDIGTSYVKMLSLCFTHGIPAIAGYGTREISNVPKENIPGMLKDLAFESGISVGEAAVSISGPDVSARFITMPRMKDSELKSAVRFEAERFISFNIADCVMDFQILNNSAKDGKLKILLVTAKKDRIMDKVNALKDAGFVVRAMDVDAFAMANAFIKNYKISAAEKTSALVNIGAKYANLAILRGDSVCFVRDIAHEKADAAQGSTKKLLAALIDEVKLSFSYHENQSGHGVDEVFVSGGLSTAKEIDEAFQEHLGVKTAHWNPLGFIKNFTADANKPAHCFAVAAGLALK
jgi:type IV pilus assembly protein PilM